MEDPFQLDQQAVDDKLKVLQENVTRWRRIKKDAETFLTTPEELADAEDELNWLTNEIQKSVKSIGWELDDLGETLRRMSETTVNGGTRRQQKGEAARARYLRDTRDLLVAIEAEVRAGSSQVAEARGDDDAPVVEVAPQPLPPIAAIGQRQQPISSGSGEDRIPMSASTERLVESLFHEEDEEDDVALLVEHEARGRFSVVSGGDVADSLIRRIWGQHKVVVMFIGLMLLLLLLILIISISAGKRGATNSVTPTTASYQEA